MVSSGSVLALSFKWLSITTSNRLNLNKNAYTQFILHKILFLQIFLSPAKIKQLQATVHLHFNISQKVKRKSAYLKTNLNYFDLSVRTSITFLCNSRFSLKTLSSTSQRDRKGEKNFFSVCTQTFIVRAKMIKWMRADIKGVKCCWAYTSTRFFGCAVTNEW